MKRILFYYDNFCGADSRGGTEVATSRIAAALKAHGDMMVYNACLRNAPAGNGAPYDGIIQLDKKNFDDKLGKFLADNRIEAVVNMGRFFRHKKLEGAIKASGTDVKLLFMHHFAPGSESKKHTYKAGWHLLRMNPANPLYWLRATFYPMVKLPRRLNWRKIYRKVYEMSDRVVLLSKGYVKEYASIAGISETEKFAAIHNIYDPPTALSPRGKEKRVLILSRMDEIQKRISLALKIWHKVEDDPELKDWELDIVGSGHDMAGIRKLARKLGLKRVTFHGWKDGKPFLEKDSILMMTSDYEGLSLSMIEAGVYGCVPVAYDSYASVADIIDDGKTGMAVPGFGDTEGFYRKLAALMKDDEGRKRMASEAKLRSAKFSSDEIASQWIEMLEKIE